MLRLIFSCVVLLLSIIMYYFLLNSTSDCPSGHFRLAGMSECHEWLSCDDYKDMKIKMFLQKGVVKEIFLVRWRKHHFVLSKLAHRSFKRDFKHNIDMLKLFSPSPFVVQLVGHCNDSLLFTEYQSFGDALKLPRLLTHDYPDLNRLSMRFDLCLNYVQIIEFLHNHPKGTFVMCDSNSLDKTLSQFLVNQNLKLIVNDLDALPNVKQTVDGIKCGHRQLFGNFVAPEQLWPHDDRPFDDAELRGYDEKTDIWKIPEVCEWFLSMSNDESEKVLIEQTKSLLSDIHNKCKDRDPGLRPSASQVLKYYQTIQQKISKLN